MIQMPAYVLVLVLLALPISVLVGALMGSWVHHCARSGKSPIPAAPAALSRVLTRKADDEPKPAENGRRPPPLMKP